MPRQVFWPRVNGHATLCVTLDADGVPQGLAIRGSELGSLYEAYQRIRAAREKRLKKPKR